MSMSMSTSVAIQTLRAEQRRLRDGGVVPRLWGKLRGEWRRMVDRTTAQAVVRQRARRA